MEPMPGHLRALVIASLFVGPMLLVLRANVASPLEKFLYATMMGPMVLLVMSLHYAGRKKQLVGEPDPQVREARLADLRKRFWTLFLVVLIACVVGAASVGWFLFRLAPEIR